MTEGIEVGKPVEIKSSPIAELEQPMKYLLTDLAESIKRGDFDLIISDDVGGRIPTLVLSKVIGAIYKENRRKKPILVFLPVYYEVGHTRAMMEKRTHFFSRHDPSKKALLVTEYVGTGKHLFGLNKLLGEEGINFDIAAVFVKRTEDYYRKEGVLSASTRLFCGYNLSRVPSIYNERSSLTGLEKILDRTIVARDEKTRESVITAREDVEELSKRLIVFLNGELNN